MYEQVDKTKEIKSRAVATSVAQKKSNGKQGLGFMDNRPGTEAQIQMIQMMRSDQAVIQAYHTQKGRKKGGTFVGYPAAIHCHIDIRAPHLKLGGKGVRYDFGNDMNSDRMQIAYDALLQYPNKKALGYSDCKEYLEEKGCRQEEVLDEQDSYEAYLRFKEREEYNREFKKKD